MNRTSKARTVAGAVALLGAGIGASSYQACSVYDSSLIGTSPGGGVVPACNHALPPPRPDGGDDGGGNQNIKVVAAFNTIDIGVAGDVDAGIPAFGFDLDNDCTCPGLPSCITPSGEVCDDEAGRDNTDIALFQALRAQAAAGTNQIDQGLSAGQFGLLLVITNYNGQAFDSAVTVDFYVSNGLNRSADGGIPTPQLNGSDLWTLDPRSVSGGQPVYRADTAYVTDYQLVAYMPEALPIAFGDQTFLGGATMLLYEAVIVGKLTSQALTDGGTSYGYGLSGGTIAGRWPTSQILATLAFVPQGGGFLCGATSIDYQIIKGVLCQNADISTLHSADNMNAPCDAISVGMQFTAVPAQLGDVFMVPPAEAGCGTAGMPWSDHCP